MKTGAKDVATVALSSLVVGTSSPGNVGWTVQNVSFNGGQQGLSETPNVTFYVAGMGEAYAVQRVSITAMAMNPT
jgi:hypothetical protein